MNGMDFEHIAFAEVNPALGGGHERFKERLHDWALDVLRTGRHEAGLFCFSYCSIDGDDEPDDYLANILLAWDGTEEVVPDGASTLS